MFIFGHLGLGRLLAEPCRIQRPMSLVLFGSLLPDIVDKSIFYITGSMPGTRSLGHTLLFVICIATIEGRRSGNWKRFPLAFGIFTHLIGDYVGDYFALSASFSRNLRILLWPILGESFPATPHLNFSQQAIRLTGPYFLSTEILGICVLALFARPRKT